MGSASSIRGTTHPGMDPPIIVALEMGGYNSVIQVASDYCSRVFDLSAGFTRSFFANIPAAEFHAILAGGAPLTSETLLRLMDSAGVSFFQIETQLSVTSLRFENPDRVCVTFHGPVYVEAFYRNAPPGKKTLETAPSTEEALKQQPLLSDWEISASAMAQPVADLLASLARQNTAASNLLASIAHAATLHPGLLSPPIRGELIGTIEVEVCCPYVIETNRERAHIDVLAQLNRSTLRTSASVERMGLIDRLIGVRGSLFQDVQFAMDHRCPAGVRF